MITGEAFADSYRNGVYGRLRPRNNFSMEDGGGWGAWELGLRYSAFDGSDFTTTNSAGTGVLAGNTSLSTPVTVSTNKADAYTVQLKWLPNAYTRFLIDYVRPARYAGHGERRNHGLREGDHIARAVRFLNMPVSRRAT
jgi:phosphate-selective porin OprO/OprP